MQKPHKAQGAADRSAAHTSRALPTGTAALLLALFLGLATPALSAPLAAWLRLPDLQLPAAEPLRVSIAFHNESPRPQHVDLPARLMLSFRSRSGEIEALQASELTASSPVHLAPGAYTSKTYQLQLPANAAGFAELAIADQPQSRVLIEVLPARATAEVELPQPLAAEAEAYPTIGNLFSLYQHYATNLTAYQPMYFLVGANPADSRFQISFKYRPFSPAGTLSERFPWLQRVYFGYTQTSFWDLKSDSAPFADTSYKPELFFLSENMQSRPGWLQGLFLSGGVRHESNGRGGEFSRSTNSVYVKPIFITYRATSELGLMLSPELHGYFRNDDETNADLADYRGHFGLELKIGKARGLVSSTELRFAKEGISLQTDLSYPISKLLRSNLDVYFQVEYVDALAESLINYQKRNRALRLGVAIVR